MNIFVQHKSGHGEWIMDIGKWIMDTVLKQEGVLEGLQGKQWQNPVFWKSNWGVQWLLMDFSKIWLIVRIGSHLLRIKLRPGFLVSGPVPQIYLLNNEGLYRVYFSIECERKKNEIHRKSTLNLSTMTRTLCRSWFQWRKKKSIQNIEKLKILKIEAHRKSIFSRCTMTRISCRSWFW